MKIQISKADLLRGETINPSWYEAVVVSMVAKAPKTGGDSMNYVPTFKIPSLDDREVPHTFNSKAIGRMGPFIAAIQGKPLKEVLEALDKGNLEFETEEAVGKKLLINIKNEEYQGRLVNKVDGFLPAGSAIPY